MMNHNHITVSNHTMVALNSLTLKVKKDIGVYKVADILEKKQLAYELFKQVILSGDDELISLTTEINKELEIELGLVNALLAYMNYIRSEKKDSDFLSRSQRLLKELSKHLYGIELNSLSYRQASGIFMSQVSSKDKTFCLNLIRSFYPYWKNSSDALLESKKATESDDKTQTKSLMRLWDGVDDAFITTFEEGQLNRYINAIKKINLSEEEIMYRTKISKLIMIRQREHDGTASGYRDNIDQLRSTFSNKALLGYFLSVSREFYSTLID